VKPSCKICGVETSVHASATIRGRHTITYYRCDACQFIQTETPFWLPEAYAEPINRSDVGYLGRNFYLSEITPSVIRATGNPDGPFLDYGGGYGVFARLMRDRGYDFRVFDRHCPNLFARDFQLDELGAQKFELVTAFEVLEHLAEPSESIDEMLRLSDNIFFSTDLAPLPLPRPDEWEYFALDHGQHVSLYSLTAIQALARRHSVHVASNGRNLHLFSRKRVAPLLFKLLTKRVVCRLMNSAFPRASLSPADQAAARRGATGE
jgi:hypothetical protein